MVYQSITNATIKSIQKLHEKKYRDLENRFLVEGEHLVREAFQNHSLEKILLLEGQENPTSLSPLYVTEKVMRFLTKLESYPSMIGVCHKLEPKQQEPSRILALDGIQDPGNLGTIIRSAVAFHVDMIILSTDTVDLYNPKVIRASQGMIFHVSIKRENLEESIPLLKAQGYPIYGTDVKGGIDVKTVKTPSKLVFIMGNEGQGMKDNLKSYCNNMLYIKMNKMCESLNVSIATAILLYELDSRSH